MSFYDDQLDYLEERFGAMLPAGRAPSSGGGRRRYTELDRVKNETDADKEVAENLSALNALLDKENHESSQ